MTRLTEALERALLVPAGPPRGDEPEPQVKSGEEVLRTWHFDIDDPRPPVPSEPRVKKPDPAAVRCTFSPAALDKLVVGDQADAGLVEQYRRVAAVLHHAQIQRVVHSVMVGSAVAAEGKTLTATNVALTLSHSFDRRVLLIDADLRRPSIHEMFGLPNEHGLVDSLRQPAGGRLPVHAVARNLWVLPAGRPTSDPMSGLVSDMMKQLLTDAVEQFDWVIVDTPPVALMPDANLLARMIDAALLVISACTTPYPLVQRAAAAIGAERILGVVLNRADRSALAQEYGYYGYYDRAPREAAPRAKKRFGLFGR
jgi:capsular exopolysaccharide synthesis family protein